MYTQFTNIVIILRISVTHCEYWQTVQHSKRVRRAGWTGSILDRMSGCDWPKDLTEL